MANRILLGKPLKDGYGSCATCSQMARLSTYKILGVLTVNLEGQKIPISVLNILCWEAISLV